jgi:hypothetical protein
VLKRILLISILLVFVFSAAGLAQDREPSGQAESTFDPFIKDEPPPEKPREEPPPTPTVMQVFPPFPMTLGAHGGAILNMQGTSPPYLDDIKGQAVIGVSTGGGITGYWGAGYWLWVALGPGEYVPLSISRQGSDVRITWDNAQFPSIHIFILGSNDLNNLYVHGPTGWSDLGAFSGGEYIHTDQVGLGYTQCYYKAFVQASPTVSDFVSAECVAKINITVPQDGGLNLMGLPLYAGPVSGTFVDQLPAGEEINLYPRSGGGLDSIRATSTGVVGQDFSIDPTIGFWMKNPGSSDITITFMGSLDAWAYEKPLEQLDLSGNPLPINIPSSNIGSDGDVINPQSGGGLDRFVRSGGNWPGFQSLGLTKGFWYKYSTNNRKWMVDPKNLTGEIVEY